MAKFDDRCANCGGKFGLVCHRHWGLRFCRKVCKTSFLGGNPFWIRVSRSIQRR
jgi:hypothetical protein